MKVSNAILAFQMMQEIEKAEKELKECSKQLESIKSETEKLKAEKNNDERNS